MNQLRLARADADLFVPDGADVATALARTTDLGVGAHPDDLEFMCLVPIGQCRDDDERWFTGITCTDGAGSARGGRFAELSDEELVAVRADEQREAATIGGYGAMVQLRHPSADVKSEAGQQGLVDELTSIIGASRPVNVYTHNLADKHDTHVAVAMATVHAIRALPTELRPAHLVGVEGWRDLDWLPDGEKLRFDATPFVELGDRLAAVFASQIEGAKRYDRAARGRRIANATLHDIASADHAEEVIVAMDLTPLVRNDDLDPAGYVRAAVGRFERDTVERIGRFGSR